MQIIIFIALWHGLEMSAEDDNCGEGVEERNANSIHGQTLRIACQQIMWPLSRVAVTLDQSLSKSTCYWLTYAKLTIGKGRKN